MSTRFYFATCQVGVEKIVKAEVLQEFPQLKFAFSRPGFITFKEEASLKTIQFTTGIFTRHWGEVLSQAKTKDALKEAVAQIPPSSIIHAFDRDLYIPGDEPDEFVLHENSHAIAKELKLKINQKPHVGDGVYDLIWIDDFHVFIGKHTHQKEMDPAPGNIPALKLPGESPSRAYLKIEEAIHRFNPEIKKGMHVLEVGCSPGGATICMLRKGLFVTGVDPKYMAESLYKEPNFKFVRKLAKNVEPQDLEDNPDWIVMDMNIAPLEALDELGHVISCLKKNFGKKLKIRQGFLTIKLNDLKFAESIPLYLKRIEEIGFRNLRPIQLCTNRQEFFVAAGDFKN